MTLPNEHPVRLASSTGRILFKAPYLFGGAFSGLWSERNVELGDDLIVTFVQVQPMVMSKDDYWIANRPMSKAETKAFLREVERRNQSLEVDPRPEL